MSQWKMIQIGKTNKKNTSRRRQQEVHRLGKDLYRLLRHEIIVKRQTFKAIFVLSKMGQINCKAKYLGPLRKEGPTKDKYQVKMWKKGPKSQN